MKIAAQRLSKGDRWGGEGKRITCFFHSAASAFAQWAGRQSSSPAKWSEMYKKAAAVQLAAVTTKEWQVWTWEQIKNTKRVASDDIRARLVMTFGSTCISIMMTAELGAAEASEQLLRPIILLFSTSSAFKGAQFSCTSCCMVFGEVAATVVHKNVVVVVNYGVFSSLLPHTCRWEAMHRFIQPTSPSHFHHIHGVLEQAQSSKKYIEVGRTERRLPFTSLYFILPINNRIHFTASHRVMR